MGTASMVGAPVNLFGGVELFKVKYQQEIKRSKPITNKF